MQPGASRALITERPYVSRAILVFMAAGIILHVYEGGLASLFTPAAAIFLFSGLFLSAFIIGGLNYLVTTSLARALIIINAYSSEGIGMFRLISFLLTMLNYAVSLYITRLAYESFYLYY